MDKVKIAPMQIPFDIPVRDAFGEEDYLVTSSNREAVMWIDRWPEWHDNHCFIIYGTAGCGKTHLSHVWQYKAGAVLVNMDQIDVANLQDISRNLIIEDIEGRIDNPEQQAKLFHLYNWQKQKGGFLFLTAQTHPKYWKLNLPDLKSRMLASMAIEIGCPDDELLAAVIIKQFADRQITVPSEVVNYLLLRIERSFEAARNIVSRIDNLSLSQKRKITVPLIRDLLG